MFYFIDVLIIAFIISIVVISYKKGLINVAYKILSFFIAIVISLVLFKPVSYFIVHATPIDEKVNSYVYTIINNRLTSKNNLNNEHSSNLPKSVENFIDKSVEETQKTVSNNIATAVSGSITSSVINILSFLSVYIITSFILMFVHLLSDTIAELPIVKEFNEIGGIIYGIIKSFLILFIILALISIFPFESIQLAISKTYITLFLYNINPILWIFLQ